MWSYKRTGLCMGQWLQAGDAISGLTQFNAVRAPGCMSCSLCVIGRTLSQESETPFEKPEPALFLCMCCQSEYGSRGGQCQYMPQNRLINPFDPIFPHCPSFIYEWALGAGKKWPLSRKKAPNLGHLYKLVL